MGERFDEVKEMYRRVNFLFGDLVKVTPSSKVVGDMALYMVQNDLDEDTVINDGYKLDFPESVVSFFKGDIGQPVNGFNKKLQDVILKDSNQLLKDQVNTWSRSILKQSVRIKRHTTRRGNRTRYN